MTTETTQETTDDQIKNPAAVLTKNKQLLTELATIKAELDATKAALEASQAETVGMRARWHESAVMAPFDALLQTATALPTKYLREGLI